MSIPLDRLYNFLDSVSNCHDLIIYGWKSHGSKKLRDLTFWRPITDSWKDQRTHLVLIFHDQEPLDYDFSQQSIDQEFCDVVKNYQDGPLLSLPKVQEFYKKMHFTCVAEKTFYDLSLLVHSEKNSYQVEKYKQNNFVSVYYWSHAIIAKDWFRFAEHDILLKTKSSNPKTFLIYNRAWAGSREYRIKFAEQLVTNDLYQDCITSFAELDNNIHYTNHVFKNLKFAPRQINLENILPKNTHNSTASADYNSLDYQNSMIEVVLETLFDDSRNHLTEKSLRPIACGQPFIIAGAPGSLQYLKDYGFKTFDGHINESYDDIQNSSDRLGAIIQEMKRINNMTSQQKQQLIKDVQHIVEHNQKLFFSKEFHEHVINEFKQNLNQAVETVKSGPVGNVWKQSRYIVKNHYPELYLQYQQYQHQDVDDLAWAEQWIQSQVKS
jgi:hypothetical protein